MKFLNSIENNRMNFYQLTKTNSRIKFTDLIDNLFFMIKSFWSNLFWRNQMTKNIEITFTNWNWVDQNCEPFIENISKLVQWKFPWENCLSIETKSVTLSLSPREYTNHRFSFVRLSFSEIIEEKKKFYRLFVQKICLLSQFDSFRIWILLQMIS